MQLLVIPSFWNFVFYCSFVLLLFREINIPVNKSVKSALVDLSQMRNKHPLSKYTVFILKVPYIKDFCSSLVIWAWFKQLFILIYVQLSLKLTPELQLNQARHPRHCLLVCRLISLAFHRKLMSFQKTGIFVKASLYSMVWPKRTTEWMRTWSRLATRCIYEVPFKWFMSWV